MVSEIRVTVRGFPEEVQRVADALERAFPEALDWQTVATPDAAHLISLDAVGAGKRNPA